MQITYDNPEHEKTPFPIQCQLITDMDAQNRDFHFHNCYELYLLLDGEISYFVEQSCYHMKPGDMMIFTDQEIHKAVNRLDTPFTRMVIHIDPLYVWQFSTGQTNLLRCFHQHRPGMHNLLSLSPERQLAFQDYFYLLYEGKAWDDYGRDIRGMVALMNLLLMVNEAFIQEASPLQKTEDHRLYSVMNYISQHLEESLTLDSIADHCGLDKYYLSHLFKKETDSTIFQYIMVKRIALAKELLSLGSSVADACTQSGFHDYANFIRTFKKVTGCPPGVFRKQFL